MLQGSDEYAHKNTIQIQCSLDYKIYKGKAH